MYLSRRVITGGLANKQMKVVGNSTKDGFQIGAEGICTHVWRHMTLFAWNPKLVVIKKIQFTDCSKYWETEPVDVMPLYCAAKFVKRTTLVVFMSF